MRTVEREEVLGADRVETVGMATAHARRHTEAAAAAAVVLPTEAWRPKALRFLVSLGLLQPQCFEESNAFGSSQIQKQL